MDVNRVVYRININLMVLNEFSVSKWFHIEIFIFSEVACVARYVKFSVSREVRGVERLPTFVLNVEADLIGIDLFAGVRPSV